MSDATPKAEKLIKQAQMGQLLSAKERRHCISYLMGTRPEFSQTAMADLFQVSERMIRYDVKHIRKDKAELIKQDDVGLVIADIVLCFDKQVRDMEASKAKCRLGTMPYLNHCKTIFNTQLLKVKAMQDLGYYPKNLGNLTVDKFEFKAVVTPDNSVTSRPVNMDLDGVIDTTAEKVEARALEAGESVATVESGDESDPEILYHREVQIEYDHD